MIAAERERAPEIAGYHKLRARRAGARRYIDLHLQFRSGTTLEQRARARALESAGRSSASCPNSDVLIHTEPEESLPPARGRGP